MIRILFLILLFSTFSVFAQQQDSKTKISQLVPKAGSGRTSVPLTEEKILADGSAGLAHHTLIEDVPAKTESTERQVRRLRAVEKDYSLPTSTFPAENLKQTQGAMDLNIQTMPDAVRALNKERYRFEECPNGDKNCQDFEVDSAGEVIFK